MFAKNRRPVTMALAIAALFLFALALLPGSAQAEAASVPVTVQLLDSTGGPLSGGLVTYYSGGWQTLGTTDVTGQVAGSLPPGTYTFSMKYLGGTEKRAGVVITTAGPNVVTFNTVEVEVQLQDSGGTLGSLPEEGEAKYYASGWKTIGTTGGGSITAELLPLQYSFSIKYRGATAKKVQNVGGDPVVIFKTAPLTVELRDSFGAIDVLPEEGFVKFYASGWKNLGATVDGAVSSELLPLTYSFSMKYGGGTQKIKQAIAPVGPNVVLFSTTLVTVELRDSNGVLGGSPPLDDGLVKYYASGWKTFGTTSGGMAIKELLPLSYTFSMKYAGGTEKMSGVNTAVTPLLTFQTEKMVVKLQTCGGVGIPGGEAKYYASGWKSIGTTDALGETSKELLPLTYTFSMKHLGKINKQRGVGVSPANPLIFETTSVAFQSSGPISFYSSGWKSFTSPMEMLPGSYTFKFDGTKTVVEISGCSINQVANVIKVSDHAGAPIAGATARGGYGTNYQSWHVAGETDANGILFDFRAPPAPGSTMSYEVKVNGTTANKTQDISVNSLFEFSTNLLTLRLQECTGDPIDGGNPRYGVGSAFGTWYFPGGVTGSSAPGETAAEVFPGEYSFEMQFKGTAEKKLNVVLPDANQVLVWETSTVTLVYPGSISYGGAIGDSAWFTQPSMELLSGTYKFHYRAFGSYPGYTTDITIAGCDTAKTLVSVSVDDCAGGHLPGVTFQWYKYGQAGNKHPVSAPSTATGPLTFFIDEALNQDIVLVATYHHQSKNSPRQNPATNPFFSYTNQLATVSLVDHAGGAIPLDASSNVRFYAHGQAANKYPMTLVGGIGQQCLLPGSYQFLVSHNLTSDSSGVHDIAAPFVFQTGAVINGTFDAAQYYQYGNAANKGAFADGIELLPAKVIFQGSSNLTHIVVPGVINDLGSVVP